jgi:hypothetical protein
MGTKLALTCHRKQATARPAVTCLFAGAIVLMSALAAAQEGSSAPKPNEGTGFFGSIVRWFDQQAANMNSTFMDVRKKFDKFGREADVAAKTRIEGAKDAANAVARISIARVIVGHEKCKNAPNGAPDCVAAANTMCKAQGFDSGKSVDMTTHEVCPPKVLLSGRSSGSECRNETFVSRVLCQ